MLGPCTHSVDATATYIHPLDDSWDHGRIRDEKAKIKELLLEQCKGKEPDEIRRLVEAAAHPLDVYHSGGTRYDLMAPLRLLTTSGYRQVTVPDYILDDASSAFVLRRLNHKEWLELQLGVTPRARAVASVSEQTTDEIYALIEHDAARRLNALGRAAELGSGKTIEDLHRLSADLPEKLGEAVLIFSGPPTERELFPSA